LLLKLKLPLTNYPHQNKIPLDTKLRLTYRNYIHSLRKKKHRNKTRDLFEKKLIYQIKEKLCTNNAIIVKADKSNSTVITPTESYLDKVQNFIHNNNFTNTTKDYTNKYQKDVRNSINNCSHIIPKDKKCKYINLNPAPPTIRGLIKIHKTETPIRPTVKWVDAPAYKLGKKLAKGINKYIPLPRTFNAKNSIQLMKDLTDIPYETDLKIASFDITNMYTNIPTNELSDIKHLCIQNNVDLTIQTELKQLFNSILSQNYFQFNNSYYLQELGLAMGAPTSSIFSEIYLQFLENTKIYDILINTESSGIFDTVDDILIVYKDKITDIHKMFDLLNDVSPTLSFTPEEEENNNINFLDISIYKNNDICFKIFRKPATVHIIPYDSNHPEEHKMSTIRYLSQSTNYLPPKQHTQKERI
jgi:hypothetical protein